MTTLTLNSPHSFTAITKQKFSLSLRQLKNKAVLLLVIQGKEYSTSSFSQTRGILQFYLPGIFQHRCFNDLQIPFSEEVKNTTLGHLFEHILLEYLSQTSFKKGIYKTYKGTTSWNWKLTPRGTFTITLNSTHGEYNNLRSALSKALPLLNQIITSRYIQEISLQRDGHLPASLF